MKKPLVLLIILAALVGFALLYEKGLSKRVNSASLSGAPMRELLLPELSSEEAHISERIRAIRIREGEKQVNLALNDGHWSLAERSGYPVSFDKVQRAVKFMAEMKVKGKTEIGKGIYKEMKLQAPEKDVPADQSGLQVELLDEKGSPLAGFIAGASTTTSGGASAGGSNMFGGPGELRFVRVPNGKDQDTVWSVDDSFYELSSDPKEWLDKAFVNVTKVKSAEITAPTPAESWKAERKDETSAFTLANAANGEELDTAKASLDSILSGAYFTDVLPKDKATPEFMKGAVKAKLVTFEGFTYDIQAVAQKGGGGDTSEKDYLTLKVSADIPKERKVPADEKPEDKKQNDEVFAASKKSLENRLAKEKAAEGWVYEVPSYNINVLFKKKSEVLREKQPPAPAAAPGVPALGAPGSTITPPPPIPGTPPGLQPPPSATTPPVKAPAPPPPSAPDNPVPATKPTEPPAPAPKSPPEPKAPTGAKPGDAKAAEPKPGETKPADTKPAESKPAPSAKPAEPKAGEQKPAEAKPAPDAKPPGQ